MKGPLCLTNAKNNEEYRIVLKKRNILFFVLIMIGIITAFFGFWAEEYMKTSINEKMLGVYTGFGTGLFLAGSILLIKNLLILKNEEKLKESRLTCTDERNKEIEGRAFRVASYVMIAAFYCVAMIGGLFYPVLVDVLLIVIFSFVITYFIAYRVYNSKM